MSVESTVKLLLPKFIELFENKPTDFSPLNNMLSVFAFKTNLSEFIITWGLTQADGDVGGVDYSL